MIDVLFLLALGQATSGPPSPRVFFHDAEVDFWGDRKKPPSRSTGADGTSPTESIWAEPIKLPDGRTTIYVPPRAVLGFLENPTRESATAYLAWQEERMKKLKAAMELLREIKAERAGPETPPEAAAAGGAPMPPPVNAGEILYFKKQGCPWCLEEDKAIAELLRAQPHLKVRTIALEEAPELARAYDVRVVPTLVVPARGGRSIVLRGYVPAPQLARVIEEVNRHAQ